MLENAADRPPGGAVTDAAAREQRGGRRHITVLRIAKLIRAHGDEFGVIRNISAGGVMVHLYSPASVGERFTIEFKSGRQLAGVVRWVNDDDAGVAFDETIDIVRFLAGEDDIDHRFEPRAPRLDVGLPAVMRCGVRVHPIVVHDISQGGLKFRAIAGTECGQAVAIRIAGLPPLTGSVRWRDEERAGVAFDAPIPLAVLARWAAETDRPR